MKLLANRLRIVMRIMKEVHRGSDSGRRGLINTVSDLVREGLSEASLWIEMKDHLELGAIVSSSAWRGRQGVRGAGAWRTRREG